MCAEAHGQLGNEGARQLGVRHQGLARAAAQPSQQPGAGRHQRAAQLPSSGAGSGELCVSERCAEPRRAPRHPPALYHTTPAACPLNSRCQTRCWCARPTYRLTDTVNNRQHPSRLFAVRLVTSALRTVVRTCAQLYARLCAAHNRHGRCCSIAANPSTHAPFPERIPIIMQRLSVPAPRLASP